MHVLANTIIDIMMSKLCLGIILQHSFMKQSKCCEDIVAPIFVENYNTQWMRTSVRASGCQCQSRYCVSPGAQGATGRVVSVITSPRYYA